MTHIKVLLIEDDPMVQEVNREFIKSVPGFQVAAVAGNGEQGIQLIKDIRPDLVVLDVYMPKKDGVKTLQDIRKQKMQVDVIVISAAKDKETIGTMLQNGARDYIIKPFKFERMKESLESYKAFKSKIRTAAEFSQEMLDDIIRKPAVKQEETWLPKGLNVHTMNEIKAYMRLQDGAQSAEEVANALGIARVTARRYLDFLVKEGELKLDMQYGGVGRPVNKYIVHSD
ncbi:response regulator [Bacillus altitudinis]|uniref:response regulator n=1 Tax=Bacillus altitudinis TaxID=293387 RepID=UPI002409047A|nr:response regulator [Bacillus altitudinis]MDI6560719.1 response regulator [Bacillus altitudinis]WEZ70067.1 response regulator [Bacillus altitudinis]